MKVGVVTLFPELFASFLEVSFVGRAIERGVLQVHLEALRAHGLGNYATVDDTPYGGGSGMVMRVDCVVAAMESAERALGGRAHRVLLTPQGRRLDQTLLGELATKERVLLVCGRYEGFDERTRQCVDSEVSLGDFVLTGGEVAAMAIVEIEHDRIDRLFAPGACRLHLDCTYAHCSCLDLLRTAARRRARAYPAKTGRPRLPHLESRGSKPRT